MAAARRTPAGSRAGAGPAPRGPRRRFASSSRGPVSGSSRPYPRRHPAAVDGRISALAIAMHAGSFRAAARARHGPARSPRPRLDHLACVLASGRCISMEPSRVLHIAATAAAAQTVSGT